MYSLAAHALASAGRDGGLAGHYMERLWRAIFFCSLGGRCIHDVAESFASDPSSFVYPRSRYLPRQWEGASSPRVPIPPEGVQPWVSPWGENIA